MSACPFGAIADKSQIFQLIQAIKKGDEIVAAVAPAIIGQFGPKVTPGRMKSALLALGFKDVYEVAVGADVGCIAEARWLRASFRSCLQAVAPRGRFLSKSSSPTLLRRCRRSLRLWSQRLAR